MVYSQRSLSVVLYSIIEDLMMEILLTITEDKVKLVSHLTNQHVIEDVLHFKNCVSEITHSTVSTNMKNVFLKSKLLQVEEFPIK